MRHRSNIAFILLAAALFAAPQMAQDLSTLKSAVAARIRGEILHAFLGLHSNESAAAATQAPRAEAPGVACAAAKQDAAQPAARTKGADRTAPAQRGDASPRTQSAMLTDPADKTNAGLPPAAAEFASLPRQLLDETKLAMLTPPGNGVEPPPPAVAYRYEAGDTLSKATRDKIAAFEKQGVFVQARFDFERDAKDARWINRIAEDVSRAKGNEGVRGKARVIKFRRQGRACGGDDNTPCAPLPVAALAKPDAATQLVDGE